MQNRINFTVGMQITDDETFKDEHSSLNRAGVVVLDPQQPSHSDLTVGKCGGEVRIEFTSTYQQLPQGKVRVSGKALLFEGTSENSNDLDGQENFTFELAPAEARQHNFRVRNTAEGGDYADIQLGLQNLALSNNDPCGNITAKAAALGAAFTGPAASGCETVKGGHRVRYQNCDIYYSPSTGAHEVHGDIRAKYNAKQGPNSDLLLPVTDETATPDGRGRFNHFAGYGSIYWHPDTGPMEVRGGIRMRWSQTGWEQGSYGFPTSDELNINQNPWQWYSVFQNGVIFWQGQAAVAPLTASLSAEGLRKAFDAAFRKRAAGDSRVQIGSVSIVGISSTQKDFWRSRNRIVTFRIAGEVASGHWYIPDPNFEIRLPVLFEAVPTPNAHNDTHLQARQAGTAFITASNPLGIGTSQTVEGLKNKIVQAFSQPIALGDVPKVAGLLSFMVQADGALTLYFRPDVIGKVAAAAAQNQLDNIDF